MDGAEGSRGTPKLNAALAKVQAIMKAAKKDEVNPAFKDATNPKKAKGTPYADMASCWEAWREAKPEEHGLSVTQEGTTAPDGFVAIRTCLLHDSGEERVSVTTMPCVAKTPQAYGASTTYARRHGFKAMVGMVDEDDDGNTASGTKVPDAKPAKATTPKSTPPPKQEDALSMEATAIIAAAKAAKTVAEVEALRPRYEALKGTPEHVSVGAWLKKRRDELTPKTAA